jgi:hypothetical protein
MINDNVCIFWCPRIGQGNTAGVIQIGLLGLMVDKHIVIKMP